MSTPTAPSAETLHPAALDEAPPEGHGASLWRRHRRPAGLAALALTALSSVCALVLSEEGPAILAGMAHVARHGWPAVALTVSLVAFAAILRAVVTLQQTNVALHGYLTEDRARTDRALTRIEENQERMAVVLERLVERTQPGLGPVSFPPHEPQRATSG